MQIGLPADEIFDYTESMEWAGRLTKDASVFIEPDKKKRPDKPDKNPVNHEPAYIFW